MQTRRLGKNGPELSILGLGCMGMSDFYGPADEAESIATIHAALERGVTLLDTGDFYGMGHNEMLIGRALKGRPRDKLFIQVKFGALRDVEGRWFGYAMRPAHVKTFLAYTLKRLRTDYIDLYQPARVAPDVPIEETVGAIAEMVKAGYVRHIGLSEAGAQTIRRAHKEHPVTSLQIEYSLMSRGIEAEILPTIGELGIGMTAYGVLSRGLLTGVSARIGDFRLRSPRWKPENLERNQALAAALARVGQRKGTSAAQLAIAWVLTRGDDILPLIGARKRTQLDESLKAVDLKLDARDIAEIEAAVPAGEVAGDRYDPHQMAMLDSERTAAG
jgi:pyridoxine 4-dehydrogenase